MIVLVYAIVTPVIHYTMGGLRFNSSTEVLQAEEDTFKPITGLFAVGEITGGLHGEVRRQFIFYYRRD